MDEPTQIGLSIPMHAFLSSLKDNGHFDNMFSGYQFAIALSIRKGLEPKYIDGKQTNMYSVVTVDPNREIYTVIKYLYGEVDLPRYTVAERLADAGLRYLHQLESEGQLDFLELIRDLT